MGATLPSSQELVVCHGRMLSSQQCRVAWDVSPYLEIRTLSSPCQEEWGLRLFVWEETDLLFKLKHIDTSLPKAMQLACICGCACACVYVCRCAHVRVCACTYIHGCKDICVYVL